MYSTTLSSVVNLTPKQRLVPTGAKSIEWIAGLFGGEGCLTYKKRDIWALQVKMTDSDVMWDLYESLGCRGNLSGLTKHPSAPDHWKPHMTWRTDKRDLIKEIVLEMYPYLGERRRAKINDFLTWYEYKTAN